MRYINLPGTTLNPSVISLGTNRFGSLIDRDVALALLDEYIELGGTLIDTAHIYADWIPGAIHSASEKTIGAWLHQRNCRTQIVLATKVGHPNLKTPHISRLSARELLDDLAESLEFLQTDYIDLLWLHRDDPGLLVGEIVDAMNRVLETGKARYMGCSNWRASRIREANEYARANNLRGFVANQPQWSLAVPNREALSDPERLVVFGAQEFALHSETGMAVIAYSAQAQGFFDKLNRLGVAGMADKDRRGYFSEANARLLPAVKSLAEKYQVSINALALSYLMAQPFVTIPVVGPRTIEQLRDCVAAVDVILSRDELNQLQIQQR